MAIPSVSIVVKTVPFLSKSVPFFRESFPSLSVKLERTRINLRCESIEATSDDGRTIVFYADGEPIADVEVASEYVTWHTVTSPEAARVQRMIETLRPGFIFTRMDGFLHAIRVDRAGWKLPANVEHCRTQHAGALPPRAPMPEGTPIVARDDSRMGQTAFAYVSQKTESLHRSCRTKFTAAKSKQTKAEMIDRANRESVARCEAAAIAKWGAEAMA